MRNVRRALKRRCLRASRGDSSTRAAIAIALGLVLVVAGYVGWLLATGRHG